MAIGAHAQSQQDWINLKSWGVRLKCSVGDLSVFVTQPQSETET